MKLKLSFIVLALLSLKSFAEMDNMDMNMMKSKGASLFGDFRYRYQKDDFTRNQNEWAGTTHNFRFRAGVKYRLGEKLMFKGRLRTGQEMDQQRSYQQMGGDFGTKPVVLDLAYAKGKVFGIKYMAGKQPFPLWKQNSLYWDDDVTPEGLTFSKHFKGADDAWKVRFTLGTYAVRPAGLIHSDDSDTEDSSMMAVGLGGKFRLGEGSKLKWAVNRLSIENIQDPATMGIASTVGDGQTQSTMVVSAAWMSSSMMPMPIGLGIDYITGERDNLLTTEEALKDETSGMIMSLKIGKLKEKGDWKLKFTNATIGKYAIAPQFAQDHWGSRRFGMDGMWTGGATNAPPASGYGNFSNMKGQGIELAYATSKMANLAFRYYKVSTAEPDTDNGSVEDESTRMLIDYSLSFK